MSGELPGWLERLLGLEAAPGEGTVWRLETTWEWAPWVTLVFVVFAFAWFAIIYSRDAAGVGRLFRWLLLSMRLALVALVMFMLTQALVSFQRTGLPYVVVLVDDSESMSIVDRYADPKMQARLKQQLSSAGLSELKRFDLARSLLLADDAKLLHQIADRYKLKLYLVSATAQEQAGELPELVAALKAASPAGQSSRLGTALRRVLGDLRGSPPAAVVLLSDGVTTEGEPLSEAADYALRKGVSVFTVGVGDEKPIRDLALGDLLVNEVVFVDDVVTFEATMSASGAAGESAKVVLKQKGSDKPLASTTVTLPPTGQTTKVRLSHRPKEVGEFEFTLQVEPLADEIQLENNKVSRMISVRKEKIRVLFVQGIPSFEFRYIKNMLERDSTIELHVVLQDADLAYADFDKSALRVFPVRREELFQYDVILFGDANPGVLSSSVLDNIRAFVEERGGGVVFISGPLFTPSALRGTPLERLLPIDLAGVQQPAADADSSTPFRLEPTEAGLASPAFQLGDTPAETLKIWQELTPLYWMVDLGQLKPAASVLATHPTRLGPDGRKLPLVTLQWVGAGRVMLHATDETWRWRLRVGDIYFARYWVQTIRFLARSKLLDGDRVAELTVDRNRYRRGEQVKARVRFHDERPRAPASDDGVTLTLEQQGQPSRRIQLARVGAGRGLFEGSFTAERDGQYHAWLASPTFDQGAPSADFLVEAPLGEFERTEMDVAELARTAEKTKGHFYRLDQTEALVDDLPSGRQVPIESLPPKVLWNRPWVAMLFMALLVGEWLLRKKKGML